MTPDLRQSDRRTADSAVWVDHRQSQRRVNGVSTAPADEAEQLQQDMEAARIAFERWRRIRRPTLREEYQDKYDGLKADAQRERDLERGGGDA